MMNSQKKLCPFKKETERVYNGLTGKAVTRERFAFCAGERCIAYRETGLGPYCLRMNPDSRAKR